MTRFLDDFRFGLRLLRRSPGVAITAVLALALAIGANSAIFSAVYNVMLKPLPVREPDRIVVLAHSNPARKLQLTATPYPDVVEWRRQLRSLESIAAVSHAAASLANGTEPERVSVGKVNESFFPMLGVGTVLGRNFLREEDQPGKARAAILSHELWNRRFASNPNVPGAQILLDGDAYTVVGVLPPRFRWVGQKIDLWVPLAAAESRGPRPAVVTAYARLKPGIRAEQLQAELDILTAATSAREPRYKGWRLTPAPLNEWIVPDVRTSLWMLLAAVGLVLLMACANVANLLLARAAARQREMALRAALGAGRGRLMVQLLAESAPLGLAGGALGLLLAWWCVRALPLLDAGRIPRLAETSIDPAVLAFTAGLSVATCLFFGLVPALALSRVGRHDSLKEGGRSSGGSVRGRRLRGALVVAEVAIAVVLATGATLMVRTFVSLSEADPGFDPGGILAGGVDLPRHKLTSPDQVLTFAEAVLARLRSTPGVESAGLTNSLPLGGNYFRGDWQVEGRANPDGGPSILDHRSADPGYFRALRIPLRRGRYMEERDRKGAEPVVLLNEAAARRLFPGEDPIGRRIGEPHQWRTVVGVIADIKHTDVAVETTPEVILPFLQAPAAAMTFVVRLDPALYPDPMRFATLLRHTVASVSPGQGVHHVLSLDRIMANRLAPRRLSMTILIAFAGLSLVLAAMGIYGVLAFSVEKRTQEIGVRMALGARARDVLAMVVREAVVLAGCGVGAGVVAALALARMARSILFGVSASDPVVFTAAGCLLLAVAALSAWIPARRAVQVDPLAALRYE